MKKILIGLILGVVIVGGVYYFKVAEAPQALQTSQQSPGVIPPSEHGMVGATIPTAVTRYETSLEAKITAADTSMTLNSDPLFVKTGVYLTGPACFTVDEGNTNVEDVCGTASGTAITNMTRGISPINGTSSISSLASTHRKGASVKITDSPQILVVSRILNGQETIPNIISYDPSVSSSSIALGLQNVVDVALLNSVTTSGAPNASTITKGIVQAGTILQIAGSTQNGSTGAVLFAAGNLYASSSPGTQVIAVTQTNGTLNANFIDKTALYNWTGAATFSSATTTLNATTSIAASASNNLILNNVKYQFPSATGTGSLFYTASTSAVTFDQPAAPTSPSRSLGVNYQNTSGHPLLINVNMSVSGACAGSNGGGSLLEGVGTTSQTTISAWSLTPYCANNTSISTTYPMFMIVPNNYYYQATTTSGSPSVSNWIETQF